MPRHLWKFLFGRVIIQIEGFCPEAFLNEARKACPIRRVRRRSYTVLELTVPARKVERLMRIAERRKMTCRVVGKDRLMTAGEALIRHWWIGVAAAALVTAALICSGGCYSVEIRGLEEISEFEVCALLEQNGIALPMRKSKIDLRAVENMLYHEYRRLAFAEARFSGTSLCIRLEEGKDIPEVLSQAPCTVVASKRGVILSVTVGEGKTAVKPGDLVGPGDPLIYGAYSKKGLDFSVHARGRVMAQVDYFGRAELPLKTAAIRTGRTRSARYLCMGKLRIRLSGEQPFEQCEEERRTEYTIPENMPAFIRIETVTYYEYETGVSEETRAEAETQLREQAYFAALAQLPENAELTDFSSVITESGGVMRATATVTVKEDIGMSIPQMIKDQTGAS